jgi:hypothetical protein
MLNYPEVPGNPTQAGGQVDRLQGLGLFCGSYRPVSSQLGGEMGLVSAYGRAPPSRWTAASLGGCDACVETKPPEVLARVHQRHETPGPKI